MRLIKRGSKLNIGMRWSLVVAAAIMSVDISALADTTDTSQATTSTSSALSGSYLINPNDTLDITVLGHDEMHETVTVLADGTITYPVAGTVHAAGQTIAELNATLTKALSDQFNQPQVTISVSTSHEPRVSVLGQVHSPGLFDYSPSLNILTAIAQAGGVTIPESQCSVLVMTQSGKQSTINDLSSLFNGTNTIANTSLNPGDTVVITSRDPAQSEVQVLGEVTKPGMFAVPTTGSSIVSLVVQAGGPTTNAALSRAQVMHDGVLQTVDLRGINTNLNSPELSEALLPGDTLMIPFNNEKVAVLGDVKTPGSYVIPDGQVINPINILTLAGGPDTDADLKSAVIIRTAPSGQFVSTPLDLSKYLDGSKINQMASANIIQPGDVVYVPKHGSKKGVDFGFVTSLALLGRALIP